MALPFTDVDLVVLTAGPFYDDTGEPAAGRLLITPLFDYAVHDATGSSVYGRPREVPFSATAGTIVSTTLLASNSRGLSVLDEATRTRRGLDFNYQLQVVLDGPRVPAYRPMSVRLPAGVSPVDVEFLQPTTQPNGQVVLLPAVLSVAGLTGAVTTQQLRDAGLGGSGSSAPTGGAGGFLDGNYPNPGVNEQALDSVVAGRINAPASSTRGALNGAYQQLWRPNTTYPAGATVVSPSGDIVTAKVGFTSGASFVAANWTLSPSYLTPADASATYGAKATVEANNVAIAALPTTYAATVPTAVGKLFAGLAARLTSPCRIAILGSSTPAGTGATTAADRWASRFVANLQGLYPSGLSSESAVVYSTTADFGALTAAAGVHGYDAAEGGTNSAQYLTAAEASKVGALNPRAVVHQVGANDMGDGITPVDYKANLLAAIAAIKAATAGPCVHVLVHGQERYDKATTYPWSAYSAVLTEIAAADPDNVMALDLTRTFSRVGLPAADPLLLMNADKIHLTDAGHALTADLVRRGLGLGMATPVPVLATAAATGTAARLTSETATGSSTELNARASDAGLGGASRAWIAEPASAQVAVSGGAIVRGGGTLATFFAGWLNAAPDVDFGFTIGAVPTGGTLFVDVHRAATTGTPDAYRLQVSTAGTLQLAKRVGGSTTTLGSAVSFSAGDRIVIRRIGTTLALRRNGTTVATLTDSAVAAGGYCGFAGAASLTALNVKAVTLDALTL